MRTSTLSTLLLRSPLARARASQNGAPVPRALFVGSYPPRECGIATFTEDLREAYDALTGRPSDVIAITDDGRRYAYPSCVVGEIQRDDASSYAAAARLANEHPAEIIDIQHEYGLFGGAQGSMLLNFLALVRKPVMVTLHTTLPDPERELLFVTRELCNRSEGVIVLAQAGRRILEDVYGIDSRKVRVILHGAPDVPLRNSRHFKRSLGLAGKTVLSTFGLLSRGKGIEYILDALPRVFERHPESVYLLLGETHPDVRRREGESYRESLRARVAALGIADRVFFVDRYMTDAEVVRFLLATDVYVSPSLDPKQIVSGTLSYAVACGRVAIATGYLYAKELLADGRGITVPFRDADALANAINSVLDDPRLRHSIETQAYRFGRHMTWPKVARNHIESFRSCIARGKTSDSGRAAAATDAPRPLRPVGALLDE